MSSDNKTALKPRKLPRQARSQATVDAIFDATIQVLLADGLQRLTTIRVAERAGVSIGTLYQYFPHKQALLFAVLERHLGRVGDVLQQAAESVHGESLATMVSTVVEAFVRAKTARIDEARALYAVAAELDVRELAQGAERRSRATLVAMLATASDAIFDDLNTTAFMLAAAMVGPTRLMVEGGAPRAMLRALPRQLESLCLGYLEREARPRARLKRTGAS
ncbi:MULTISPECIES: TetR/AcrR family transcriptional regulator [unclassified Caballeronia]|jgi:AcrR family transcriptional regulator|uniref:TetR/AcrR family transcriptional regulator n=1 Tax=unclassified Caballeronia TaxID=2646786 RepID=UPI00202815C8|nr:MULTISPECIES: TetR/AcrR family transcriptional regulator [unclassified Caballeronia]MDR5773936.1 TetR/AcrR family transcriptional regulator [Caballeronia sp. LZ002]MDR5800389.1 TetR/AcrR family transcriptional regulator [Caballeronia sp. LZ001]MDR5849371.1 TetR/AcrR family transcriptional regulator [Caballeronia sp. LZ003]